MLSYQSHSPNFPALVEYNFGHGFYNKAMIHLTKNELEETFQAIIITLIHTKHEYEPLSYSIVIKKTYAISD